MNSEYLDRLIPHLKEAAVPAAPGNLEQNVWRSIRQAQEGARAGGLAGLPLLRAGLVLPGLGLAILIGSTLSMASLKVDTRRSAAAVEALHFASITDTSYANLLGRR